jgi:4-hydroxybenzoate polyprenyltransferase
MSNVILNHLRTSKYKDTLSNALGATHPSLRGHLQIARLDHWFKNVFILPGIVAAISMSSTPVTSNLLLRIVVGLVATCLVASSNYVINEVMDAPFDLHHPTKCKRPVPSGRVNIPLAYAQWLLLMIVGVGLGLAVSIPFTLTLLVFWLMGGIYNLPPLRSKDLPYVDVLSEAVNNPLRMVAGWFIVNTVTIAPASLTLSYWMIGCYFMAVKRFAEYRDLDDPVQATAYRKSFAFYTEQRLLVSIMFYSSAAMLFFGAFIMRYRLELIVSFPLVALTLAIYLSLAFKEDSPVQRPERLYREPVLMAVVIVCTVLMSALMFIDIPSLHWIFIPTASTIAGARP